MNTLIDFFLEHIYGRIAGVLLLTCALIAVLPVTLLDVRRGVPLEDSLADAADVIWACILAIVHGMPEGGDA